MTDMQILTAIRLPHTTALTYFRARASSLLIIMAASTVPAYAGSVADIPSKASDPMLLHASENLTIRAHFQAGMNLVAEDNLFWNLGALAAGNTDFDPDTQWLEAFLEPGISFDYKLNPSSSLFGKFSLVGSYTGGTDAFDVSDTGRVTLEEAYLGYRTKLSSGWTLETTLGPRPLKLGTGMLIKNGGADGFERGALKFGPREAWGMAGIFHLSRDSFKATAFYLEANEMVSNDTDNSLVGIDLRWDKDGSYLGFTYLQMLSSEAPYPQAAAGGIGPPNIIANARDELHTVNMYGKIKPSHGILENFTLSADLAYQWNDDIDLQAWAGRLKAEYTFNKHPWRPVLSYSYQIFTGDDPDTNRLERFDPLYYDGSPSAWATGSKSAMVFINSNVQSHNLSIKVTPTKRDIITLRYAHVRAHQLRSPVQFGQATRLDFGDGLGTVVSGVTDAHLSDDLFLEYTRIINPNTFLTCGFSVSFPGDGIKKAAGGNAPNWTGAFLNVVINY